MSGKILVAYFSATGQTRRLARTIAAAAGGDLFEIAPEKPYTAADLDWTDNASRSTLEMSDPASRPAVAGKVAGMEDYARVFVGFPIWWYTAPRLIQTFLESYDFSGKTVIPFATSGGSDLGDTEEVLRKSCSEKTRWLPGRRLSAAAGRAEVENWLGTLDL